MTEEQFKKLDKCHFKYNLDDNCEEFEIDARSLLGSLRFDLYAILYYIRQKDEGVTNLSFARKIYKERTRCITGFKFKEDGNDQKNNYEDFIIVLDALIDDFRNDRFDASKTLIPIDKNNVLIDGAHRVACAAYFNKKVKVIKFLDREVYSKGYDTLHYNLLPVECLDVMAIEACRWHDNLYMLFLWPKSFLDINLQKKALDIIRKRIIVFYEKECSMTHQAIRNLMLQIYRHMDWIGTIENNFSSIYNKADEVWDDNGKCRFMLIQAPSCEFVLDLKKDIRNIFDMGLSSIHSTDTMDETRLAVNALFNSNSFHFLRYAKPTEFKTSYKLLEKFGKIVDESGQNRGDYIVDTSMVLAIYGVREADDLDYYSLSGLAKLNLDTKCGIEEHDESQSLYYKLPVNDLILSEENHFNYNGMKFVSLKNLLAFKEKRYSERHDEKDKNDITLIKSVLEQTDNKWDIFLVKMSIGFRRRKRRFLTSYHDMRNKILKWIGLYEFLKRTRDKYRR